MPVRDWSSACALPISSSPRPLGQLLFWPLLARTPFPLVESPPSNTPHSASLLSMLSVSIQGWVYSALLPEDSPALGNLCVCLIVQSCPTLCNPMDCSLSGSSVHGRSTRVGCYFLLQGIFPTQGSNPRLLYCTLIFYPLSHLGGHLVLQKPSGDK